MADAPPPEESRFRFPASASELERRRKAVQERMKDAKIDAVIVQGAANFVGGRERLAAAAFAADWRKNFPQQRAHVGAQSGGLREDNSIRRAARQNRLHPFIRHKFRGQH